MTGAAAAQNTPPAQAQQEEIDDLARAMAAMQLRVDRLQGKLSVDEQREAEIDLEVHALAAEIGGVNLRLEEHKMALSDPKHFKIPNTDTILTISGLVQGTGVHDFDKIDSPATFVTGKIVVDGQPPGVPDSNTTFSANTSMFAVGSTTPTDVGKLTTLLTVDFFGNTTDASPDLQLRQAWGELENIVWGGALRAGQSWSTFDDVPSIPETLDYQGPNGSLQTRHTLVRWTRDYSDDYTVWAAVEDPGSGIEGGDGLTRWPDAVLALTKRASWGYVKPAVIIRDLGGEAPGAGKDHELGWGASLASTINVPQLHEKDNVRIEAAYGMGIGSYVNDSDIDDAVFDGSDLKALGVASGSLGLQHWWTDDLRSNGAFGIVDVDNRSAQPGEAYDRTLYAALNVIWSPIKSVDYGFEFLWGERENKDGNSEDASRIMFGFTARF